MNQKNTIRNYDDINENLRFWFSLVFDTVENAVFYDIGANDGVFSIGFADKCRAVYAFEPASGSCRRLEQRCAQGGITNITVLPLALADSPGTLRLYRYSDDTFNSLYRRSDDQLSHYNLDAAEHEDVAVVRLDDLVVERRLPLPDVVKIDIEGAEFFALRGAEKTIRAAMPVILIEYSIDNTQNAGYSRDEISALLENWGYHVRGLKRNTDTTLHRGDALADRGIWNLLCVPPRYEALLEARPPG